MNRYAKIIRRALTLLAFTLLSFISLMQESQAQVLPPDFLCVRNDTLFWEQSTNTCGPFVQYEVFFSLNAAGPFTLLATLPNITDTDYHHPNPGGQTRYYFLLARHTCLGEPIFPSDTLDNLPPEVPILLSASVNGSEVEITWVPSPSPEVVGYVLFRKTPTGTVPIDTIFSSNSIVDAAAMPDLQSEEYSLIAIDGCGLSSLITPIHQTMFLQSSVLACERVVRLNWTPYAGWPDGTGAHVIWVNNNNQGFLPIDTITGATNMYDFVDFALSDSFSLQVEALSGDGQKTSFSNTILQSGDIIEPVRSLSFKNISYELDSTLLLEWSINPLAEITALDLYSSLGVSDTTFEDMVNLPVIGTSEIQHILNNPGVDEARFFSLRSTDLCGEIFNSELGAPIILRGQSFSEGDFFLEWTPLRLEHVQVGTYRVYRITDIGPQQVIAGIPGSSLDLSYNDLVTVGGLTNTYCYYIEAEGVFTDPFDGHLESIRAKSNLVCLFPKTTIFFPNAFTPAGKNPNFKPVLNNAAAVGEFRMQIFDRFGREVFTSSDFSNGWNGAVDGKIQPQGVYVYQVYIKQLGGEEIRRRGTVMLIR